METGRDKGLGHADVQILRHRDTERRMTTAVLEPSSVFPKREAAVCGFPVATLRETLCKAPLPRLQPLRQGLARTVACGRAE